MAAERPPRRSLVAAWAVHVFTASGAVLGLLALDAAVAKAWAWMFWWLGLALIVDGIDGTFARRVRVGEVLPRWSGEILDLVIDYLTYVVVPAYAIATSGLLPSGFGMPAAAVILVTSAIYFADARMKTADNHFSGFPAVWNAVAFYLVLLTPPPAVSLGVVIVLAVLTFVPIPFVHPFRVVRLRVLSLTLVALWAVLAITALFWNMQPPGAITAALVAIGLYFLFVGAIRPSGRP